jgi:hypothetical protein
MTWEMVGHVQVVVHTEEPPSDEEWRAYLDGVAKIEASVRAFYVRTDGGGPNALQRELLTKFFETRSMPPVAIVTPSVMVRGIMTALNWFLNNRLRLFSPSQAVEAFGYLQVAPADRGPLEAVVARLRGELASRRTECRPVCG